MAGLQTGAAAQACLLTVNPKLCGQDSIINRGNVQAFELPFDQCIKRHDILRSVRQKHAAYDSDFDE